MKLVAYSAFGGVMLMYADPVSECQAPTSRDCVGAIFEHTALVSSIAKGIRRHEAVIAYVPASWMAQVHGMI